MNSPFRQATGLGVVVAVGSGVVEIVLVAGATDVVVSSRSQTRFLSSEPSQSAELEFNSNPGRHVEVHGAHCCALKLSLPMHVRLM